MTRAKAREERECIFAGLNARGFSKNHHPDFGLLGPECFETLK